MQNSDLKLVNSRKIKLNIFHKIYILYFTFLLHPLNQRRETRELVRFFIFLSDVIQLTNTEFARLFYESF